MFHIKFNYFRCWESLEVNISLGKIVLIKGISGSGKTTILQGITWCLFGNIRLVTPSHLDKAKTNVLLKFPHNGTTLSIHRHKNPNRLIVIHNDQTYEDKVAQSMINNIFGSYDLWLSSCYVGQGCRNNFLVSPNSGKMELLNNLAFNEEEPSLYIERIDSQISDINQQYKDKLNIFNENLKMLNQYLSTINVELALSPEQTAVLSNLINENQEKKNKLQEEKIRHNININMLNQLKTQLSTIVEPILVNVDIECILNKYNLTMSSWKDLPLIINNINEIIPLLTQRDRELIEVNRINSQLTKYNLGNHNYTQEDYNTTLSRELERKSNIIQCSKLNISYNKNSIDDKIVEYNNIISAQPMIRNKLKYNNIKTTISSLIRDNNTLNLIDVINIEPKVVNKPDLSKFSTDELDEKLTELISKHGSIGVHIEHLHQSKDVIQCPKCKESLKYNNGSLYSSDSSPISTDELLEEQKKLNWIVKEIAIIRRKIQDLKTGERNKVLEYENEVRVEQQRINDLTFRNNKIMFENQRREFTLNENTNKIQELEKELNNIQNNNEINSYMKLLSDNELREINSLIGKLESLEIIDEPIVSSVVINQCLSYNKLLEEKKANDKSYKSLLDKIPYEFKESSVLEIREVVKLLSQSYNDTNRYYNELDKINSKKSSLQEQINNIKICDINFDQEISAINLLITCSQKSIEDSKRAWQIIQFHNNVMIQREEIVKLNIKLGDYMTFRQYMINTECHVLQEVINNINTSIDNVCELLFDNNILISLNLFKTLKSTKHVKPVVNFNISYQGGTFDNINQMSGGEGDRASLALTLALNKLSSCPIMMFDESLASLDINMKEIVIKTMRQNTNNTVIVIMHDGVEGIFDEIIDIENVKGIKY